jgi:hypothetical protein
MTQATILNAKKKREEKWLMENLHVQMLVLMEQWFWDVNDKEVKLRN